MEGDQDARPSADTPTSSTPEHPNGWSPDMSTAIATELSSPFLLANAGFVSQPWAGHCARLTSRRLKTSVAAISAHGDIDASNAGALTDYTLGHVTGCRALILDLTGVKFFGAEGISVLQRLTICCTHAGTGWAVVPSAAVSLTLRIADPHASLPTADTVEAALTALSDHPRHPTAAPRQPSGCGRTLCGICGVTTTPAPRPDVESPMATPARAVSNETTYESLKTLSRIRGRRRLG